MAAEHPEPPAAELPAPGPAAGPGYAAWAPAELQARLAEIGAPTQGQEGEGVRRGPGLPGKEGEGEGLPPGPAALTRPVCAGSREELVERLQTYTLQVSPRPRTSPAREHGLDPTCPAALARPGGGQLGGGRGHEPFIPVTQALTPTPVPLRPCPAPPGRVEEHREATVGPRDPSCPCSPCVLPSDGHRTEQTGPERRGWRQACPAAATHGPGKEGVEAGRGGPWHRYRRGVRSLAPWRSHRRPFCRLEPLGWVGGRHAAGLCAWRRPPTQSWPHPSEEREA